MALWSRHGHGVRDQEDRGHGRRWAEHVESGGWSPGAALFSPEGTRDPQTATAGPTQHGGPGNTPDRGKPLVPAPGSMRKELSAKPLHPPAARSRPQPPAPNTQSRTQRLSWAPGGTTEPFPTSASTRGCAAPTRMHSGAVRAPASSSTPPDGPPPGTKPYVTKAHEPKGLTPARISAPSPTPLLRDPASQELLPHQAGSLPHVTHLRLRLPVREGPPRGSGSGCLTCAEPTCFFLCKTTEFSSVRTLLCHSLMCPCTWEQCQVPVVANRYDTTKGVHSQVDYYTYAHVQAHAYVHTHMYMYTKVRAHVHIKPAHICVHVYCVLHGYTHMYPHTGFKAGVVEINTDTVNHPGLFRLNFLQREKRSTWKTRS